MIRRASIPQPTRIESAARIATAYLPVEHDDLAKTDRGVGVRENRCPCEVRHFDNRALEGAERTEPNDRKGPSSRERIFCKRYPPPNRRRRLGLGRGLDISPERIQGECKNCVGCGATSIQLRQPFSSGFSPEHDDLAAAKDIGLGLAIVVPLWAGLLLLVIALQSGWLS